MVRNMHPNSLENLNKPKKKKKYGFRYSIPQETVDKLFGLLTDNMKLRKAAREVGICYDTAKKYFEKGDSRRGIKPLKLRLTMFQDTITREFDKDLIERRKTLLGVVQKAITQISESIDAKLLIGKASYAQLNGLIKTEMMLSGEGTVKHEHKEGEISAEDIRDIAKG